MLKFHLEDLKMENQNYLYHKVYGVDHIIFLKNVS